MLILFVCRMYKLVFGRNARSWCGHCCCFSFNLANLIKKISILRHKVYTWQTRYTKNIVNADGEPALYHNHMAEQKFTQFFVYSKQYTCTRTLDITKMKLNLVDSWWPYSYFSYEFDSWICVAVAGSKAKTVMHTNTIERNDNEWAGGRMRIE